MPVKRKGRRRSRRPPAPVPIAVLNRRCKLCLLRYAFVIAFSVALMTYFVPYEQSNLARKPTILKHSDLTIMSYNVRASDIDTKPTTQWNARRKVAIEMINLYNPDIIGMQEPTQKQLETFKQIGNYDAYGKLTATSILYKSDKYTMMDGDTVWLSHTPHIEHSTSWDTSQERVVTWVLLISRDAAETAQCQDGDESLQCEIHALDHAYLVFNTHLDHKGESSRMEACVVIKDVIHNISSVKYGNKYPVFLTGDFNEAKYGNVWQCLTENDDDSFELQDALHTSEYFGFNRKVKLQYTDHNFRGLQMNTWYMRMAQYLYFGFSHSVVKWFRDVWFDGVCCVAPSLYRQFYRRMNYKDRAGVHHLDWLLFSDHKSIDSVPYFEVVAYHHTVDVDEQPPLIWSLEGLFYDRVIGKTIYPSDHFPVVGAFNITRIR
eukprot:682182_1